VIHKVVGHPFQIGDNPMVNAQFNIQYVIANAILRNSPKLRHFDVASVNDPQIKELTQKIHVQADSYLNEGKRELLGKVIMKVTTKNGNIYTKTVAVPSGFSLNPLTEEAYRERFEDNVSYGGKPLPRKNIDKLVVMVDQLEEIEDVRSLIPLLVSRKS
jgi:2-methylcitrate dehydratase PrpD